jgi:hypothetical protein
MSRIKAAVIDPTPQDQRHQCQETSILQESGVWWLHPSKLFSFFRLLRLTKDLIDKSKMKLLI